MDDGVILVLTQKQGYVGYEKGELRGKIEVRGKIKGIYADKGKNQPVQNDEIGKDRQSSYQHAAIIAVLFHIVSV